MENQKLRRPASLREWVSIDGWWFRLMETGRHNVVIAFTSGELVIVPKHQVQAWKLDWREG